MHVCIQAARLWILGVAKVWWEYVYALSRGCPLFYTIPNPIFWFGFAGLHACYGYPILIVKMRLERRILIQVRSFVVGRRSPYKIDEIW